jgi:hypothetical protein
MINFAEKVPVSELYQICKLLLIKCLYDFACLLIPPFIYNTLHDIRTT